MAIPNRAAAKANQLRENVSIRRVVAEGRVEKTTGRIPIIRTALKSFGISVRKPGTAAEQSARNPNVRGPRVTRSGYVPSSAETKAKSLSQIGKKFQTKFR